MPATGHADHVVDLNLAAGAHAQPTRNAGVQINRHRNMAVIQQRNAPLCQLRETTALNTSDLDHIPHVGRLIMCCLALGLVRHQQLNHHFARTFGPRIVGGHNHPFSGFADAGGGKRALALNLDHTGAAVAVRAIPRCWLVAQMRDLQAPTIGHFPNGQTCFGLNRFAIQREGDLVCHGPSPKMSRHGIRKSRAAQDPIPDTLPEFCATRRFR